MSPFSGTAVPGQAGSSSNITGDRDKQWLSRLRAWKAPEMKLPKLLRTASSKKSKKGKAIEIETVPKTGPTPGHYFEEKSMSNLLPPALPWPDNVTESPLAPSVPQETSSLSILPSLFDILPLDLKFKSEPPAISDLSSSDYGHSYRSRASSTEFSVYSGLDPSFPYPLLYESPESEPNDHRFLDRKSESSGSISPPIPEVNRPLSPEYGPSALSIDQFQAQASAISERFVKLGDGGEDDARLLPEPDKKDDGSPMMEAKAVHDISTRGPQPGRWAQSQSSEPPRSISWLPPPRSTYRGFSPRDTDTPSLAKTNALLPRPRRGSAEMPPNPSKKDSGPSTIQTKDSHDILARRRTAVANPFPFPFTEDSDDFTEAQSHSESSVFQNVGKYTARIPFSSPVIEDD